MCNCDGSCLKQPVTVVTPEFEQEFKKQVYVQIVGRADRRALKVVSDRMKLTEGFKLPEPSSPSGK